jgi:SAM-dependent methyltransferase
MAEGELVTDKAYPHLGGNVDGGDPMSWNPTLWAQLVKRFEVKSVFDVGCGQGHAVLWFRDNLGRAFGIDGLPQNVAQAVTPIFQHDLKDRPYHFPSDLVWSCEVAEHIAPQYVDNYLDTLANAPVVAMTHAMPDQAGYHHVNCQPSEYWIERMKARGYAHDWHATTAWRHVAAQDGHVYFTRSGLVFVRCAA